MGVVKWTNIYGREREGENLVSFTQHKNYEIVCNLDATFFKVNLSLESTLKEPKLINLLEIIWDDERLVNIVYAISWWKVKSLVWHWGFQQSQYVISDEHFLAVWETPYSWVFEPKSIYVFQEFLDSK